MRVVGMNTFLRHHGGADLSAGQGPCQQAEWWWPYLWLLFLGCIALARGMHRDVALSEQASGGPRGQAPIDLSGNVDVWCAGRLTGVMMCVRNHIVSNQQRSPSALWMHRTAMRCMGMQGGSQV